MIVVSRKLGETIIVGEDLEVTVRAIELDGVALSIRHSGGPTESAPQRLARGETTQLGGGSSCTLVDIRGDKVRLGVEAPKEVAIYRMEVYNAIRRENRLERRGLL